MTSILQNLLFHRSLRFLFPALVLLLAAILSILLAFTPWEQVGAPLLSFALFAGAVFAFIWLDSSAEERPFVVRLFLAAMAVHGLASLIYNFVLRGPLLDDAINFDKVASILAKDGSTSPDLGRLAWLSTDIFTKLLTALYGVLGHSPAAVVAINIALGGFSAYLIYRIAALLLGPATARISGWLAVLYSGFWIFSLMVLKDALGLFLVLFFFYALYRLWNTLLVSGRWTVRLGSAAVWLLLLIGVWMGMNQFRDYVGNVMVFSSATLIVVWIWRFRGRWAGLALVAAALAAAVLLWPRILAFSLPPIRLESDSTLVQIVEVPPTDTIGAMLGWAVEHPLGYAKYILLAAGSTAIAPFAWIFPVGGLYSPAFSPYTVAMPGMWLWYFCLPFSVLGLVSAWKRSRGGILPLVLFAGAMFLIFSILIPRETRHRDIVMPMLLILSAEGLVFCRDRWRLGLIFWVPLSLFMAWKIDALFYYGWMAAAVVVILAVRFARRGGKARIPLQKRTQ